MGVEMSRDPDTAALKNGTTAYEEGLPYSGRPSFMSDGAEKVIPKPWNEGAMHPWADRTAVN